MGYNTKYKLYIEKAPDFVYPITDREEQRKAMNKVIDTLGTSDEDDFMRPALEGDLDDCKWYTHEDDMLTFSERFPDVVFRLEGIGEEQPDMWHKYFQAGKMQKAQAIITYPEFNPAKLE